MRKELVRIVSGLYVTECITFPRSGHHLLANILQAYFGDSFHYREWYKECRGIDDDPSCNYQKNHDFDLSATIHDDRQYLVQIRNPIEAIASRWQLEVRDGTVDEAEWDKTAKEYAEYWKGFFLKWLLTPSPRRLVVRYEDIIECPLGTISNVIEFLQVERGVDTRLLKQCLSQWTPERRRIKVIPNIQFA